MQARIRASLGGKTFTAANSRATPPEGDYVAHKGRFFPVNSALDYPMPILADIAAEQTGQLVLLPTGHGAIACLSGSERVIDVPLETDDPQGFYRAILRLALSGNTRELVTIGPIANLPAKIRELANLELPPVIRRAHTRRILAAGLMAIVLGASLGTLARMPVQNRLKTVEHQIAESNAALQKASADLKTLQERAHANAPEPALDNHQKKPLPAPSDSYVDNLRAFGRIPLATSIRIQEGQIRFGDTSQAQPTGAAPLLLPPMPPPQPAPSKPPRPGP